VTAWRVHCSLAILLAFSGLLWGQMQPTDSRIGQAQAHLAKGELQQAEALLTEVIKTDPNKAEAHHLLGLAYAQTRRYADALRHLQKAVQLTPDSAEILRSLGEVCLRTGERQKAIDYFARSVSLKPEQAAIQYSLGMLYLEAGDARRATPHLELARQYGLRHRGVLLSLGKAYLNLLRSDEALEVLQELSRANPDDGPLQLQIGKMLFESLLYNDAKPPLSRAWELSPGSYEAGLYLALVSNLLGDQATSLQVLLDLKAKGARTLELENLLAAVYATMGKRDEAIALLRKLVEEAPQEPDAYFNLGLILLDEGRRAEAMEMLERGGKVYRGGAKVFYILATENACSSVAWTDQTVLQDSSTAPQAVERAGFYQQLGKVFQDRFHYASAAELLRIALEFDPVDPRTLMALGICCYNLNEISSALRIFRRVASLQPNSDQAHYFLGNCYTSLGKEEEAAQAYRKAIELSPQSGVYYYRLGKTFFRQGRMEEALAAYKSALSISPEDAAARVALGRVYQRLNEAERAAAEFEAAIRLAPALPEPYYHLAQYYARKGQAEKAREYSQAFQRKTALSRKTPGRSGYIQEGE